MNITFITPHQRHTSGGVYAIHQFAKHLAVDHDVTVAVRGGQPLPVEGCTVVSLDEAIGSDLVLYPADLKVNWLPQGRPVCLFQGFGTPGNPDVLVNLERQDPVVATATWLVKEAELHGCVAHHVAYGIDADIFHPSPNPRHLEHTVLMMTHHANWKGTEDGLEALNFVRSARSEVRITLFGVKRPEFEAEFVQSPARRAVADLLRQTAVFVCASWEEGFGMPGLEAMACGAALVTTDTKGSRDCALHGETALVVPPRHPRLLAEGILDLMEHPDKRATLVEAHRVVSQYPTWSESAHALETTLIRILDSPS